jgi:membrane-bound lytic murein transglycosylase B
VIPPPPKKEAKQKQTKDTKEKLAFDSEIYKKAGTKYGVPWQIISAIHYREHGHLTSTVRSSAGAQGCTQFMPSTWKAYGVDGDGDGKKDLHNCIDAIHGTANYISANYKKSKSIRKAVWHYNHADWYVNQVLNKAKEYGWQQ